VTTASFPSLRELLSATWKLVFCALYNDAALVEKETISNALSVTDRMLLRGAKVDEPDTGICSATVPAVVVQQRYTVVSDVVLDVTVTTLALKVMPLIAGPVDARSPVMVTPVSGAVANVTWTRNAFTEGFELGPTKKPPLGALMSANVVVTTLRNVTVTAEGTANENELSEMVKLIGAVA